MIGETGERKSAVATPDGKSRKKKKKKCRNNLLQQHYSRYGESKTRPIIVTHVKFGMNAVVKLAIYQLSAIIASTLVKFIEIDIDIHVPRYLLS